MKALVALFCLLPGVAFGQAAVQQAGSVTTNSIAAWARDHQVRSMTGLTGDANGLGVTPFSITDALSSGLCSNSAATTGQYYQFCMGHDSSGNALLKVSANNGAANQGFKVDLNGVIYDFPATVGGVTGPNPTVVGQVPFFNNTTGTLLGKDNNFTFSGGVLTVGDSTNGGYLPHNTLLPLAGLVSATGASNGLIGQVNNTVNYATTPFLAVGTTGYGKVPNTAVSVAFGLYGIGEIYNSHGVVVGGEVTARNFGGTPANTGAPPPTGAPTTNLVADGWHISCGTTAGTSDCSTGLYITNEAGGSNVADSSFANGIFVNAYRNYGLYVGAGYPSGSQIGAQIDNNGNSINLILKTTGAATPGNAVFEVVDNAAAVQAALFQNGDGHFNNLVLGNSVYLTPNSSFVAMVSPGANALSFGPDAGWTTLRIGNGTADVFLDGTAKFGTYTNTPCANAGYITIKDSGGTSRKVQVCT